MPIPWISVLSNIPWGQVVDGAPKVADAAGKLWTKVSEGRKGGGADKDAADATATAKTAKTATEADTPVPAEAHSPSEAGVAADPPARPATEVEIQRLEQQIAALQMQLDEARQVQRDADARWQGQLEDTSGLIKALADQNATLVQQTELQQRRLQSLTWGVVIGGLVLAAGLVALAVRVPGVLPG